MSGIRCAMLSMTAGDTRAGGGGRKKTIPGTLAGSVDRKCMGSISRQGRRLVWFVGKFGAKTNDFRGLIRRQIGVALGAHAGRACARGVPLTPQRAKKFRKFRAKNLRHRFVRDFFPEGNFRRRHFPTPAGAILPSGAGEPDGTVRIRGKPRKGRRGLI